MLSPETGPLSNPEGGPHYFQGITIGEADEILLELIDDVHITALFESIDKWYA